MRLIRLNVRWYTEHSANRWRELLCARRPLKRHPKKKTNLEWNHGTSLRHLRQRAALWQQHFSRAQRDAPALEPQFAGGKGNGEWHTQTDTRVRNLH